MKYLEIISEYRINAKQREHCLRIALDPDSIVFSTLIPNNTGCTRTILVSQSNDAPVIIIRKDEGAFNWINNNSLVIGLDDNAPYVDVNSWLTHNRSLLKKLCSEELDMAEFIQHMFRYRKTSIIFENSVNNTKFSCVDRTKPKSYKRMVVGILGIMSPKQNKD